MTIKIVELLGNEGDVIEYTCLSGQALGKNILVSNVGPRTISGANPVDKPFAGITVAEKSIVNGDVSTKLGVITNAIIDVTYSGATGVIGEYVTICASDNQKVSGAGAITTGTGTHYIAGPRNVGELLEGATNAEVVQVRVLK